MDVPKDSPKDLVQHKDFPNSPAVRDTVAPANIVESDVDDSTMEDSEMEDVEFGVRVVDQAALEKEIATKADQALLEGANEDDQRRLDKAINEKAKLEHILSVAEEKFKRPTTIAKEKRSIAKQIKELKEQISQFNDDITDIKTRMLQRAGDAKVLQDVKAAADQRLPNESEREFLIRTGVITPFDSIPGLSQSHEPAEMLQSAAPVGVQNLRRPGFTTMKAKKFTKNKDIKGKAIKSKTPQPIEKKLEDGYSSDLSSVPSDFEDHASKSRAGKRKVHADDDDYVPDAVGKALRRQLVRKKSISDTTSEEFLDESDDDYSSSDVSSKKRKTFLPGTQKEARLDDGDEKIYKKRLRKWIQSRQKAREANYGKDPEDDLDEWHRPHPTIPNETFGDDFRLPGDIHPSLFAYQKVAVKWLWELHQQNVGGILGDEMGTGKTVQMISFLAGLHYSGILDKPILIVAPGALLSQWASEFHTWWPAMRVAILHKSGSGMLMSKDGEIHSDDEDDDEGTYKPSKSAKFAAKRIVDRVFSHGHVLITTYEGLNVYSNHLLEKEWGYAVLDEGHKIRNPDANVSLNCKRLKTHHRIILSGTPIQNNLIELWSLFDFVFPGRLGTLPVFKEQFEVPIRLGGYKNAMNVQVQTATSCATVLRDLIGPYLLRRMKADIAKDLPKKEEKVIFCKLKKVQVAAYTEYLKSPDVARVIDNKQDVLSGISVLRKICCHPDLLDREALENKPGYDYGKASSSGKLEVLKKMVIHWKEQGHRALIFSQGTQVLDILEKNIKSYEGFKYSRMDGRTPIVMRQQLVEEFNNDSSIDVFLLTTRVGGLGLNLTGADRVIIFDPDWNPSTDLQARERSWRIGQTKPVSIFRLVAAGTIEEKMYSRQLYKQHMSQKVLVNPSEHRRFFQPENIRELFTYSPPTSGTATGALFEGAETVYSKSQPAGQREEDSALRRINGVTGLAQFGLDDNLNATKEEQGERKFIEEIFSSAGVFSSLEHDQAVGATHKPANSEYAANIAAEAAKKLQESILATQVASAPIGTVTWTGRSGTAGKVAARPAAGGLLDKLKGRANGGRAGGSHRSLKQQMRSLFDKNRGAVTTAMIKSWCREVGIDQRNPRRAAEMKATLKAMAKLDKKTHVWTLKS
ncbi:hypothetical protein FN846DRAFT_905856 [Sphaerosporella brunnea]|uniref:SNF2 family N-terminal domain-containing protein n=1 Tax=Sphaerosporella brunnea TaxID=1250544 RepID=A0A5J5F158_9PEZI|nr:hypothetical protein FN846DRAFT_905856 [Sphaerosporella brunnea]